LEGQNKSLLLNELQAFFWVLAVKVRIGGKMEIINKNKRYVPE
jgi:hypothetical protein